MKQTERNIVTMTAESIERLKRLEGSKLTISIENSNLRIKGHPISINFIVLAITHLSNCALNLYRNYAQEKFGGDFDEGMENLFKEKLRLRMTGAIESGLSDDFMYTNSPCITRDVNVH